MKGRITQASLTSLLSYKRIPDCRIAFFICINMRLEENDLMAVQVYVHNLTQVILPMLSPLRDESETKIKSIEIVP